MISLVEKRKSEHLENKILDCEKSLRDLSRKIIESQENERHRVAKELHDSIGSNLAAIKFALEHKLATMEGGPRDDFCSLENVITHIKDTIIEVRRISNGLMPAMLEDLGLLKTIRFFCQQQSEYYQHAKIIIDLNVDEENIPDIFKTTIFRVIQEALNNAFKHGEANSIQLSLIETGDSIELCVTDNGRGFDPENLTSNSDLLSGFGLKGMHHRAVVCNGTCKISSQIGKGTKVKLSLPYH